MNEGLTRNLSTEELKAIAKTENGLIDGNIITCMGIPLAVLIQHLATALLEERAKPKNDVWEYAPDGITTADVYYGNHMLVSATPDHTYTRELPKTRARQIAENIVHGINGKTHGETKDIEYVEGVLKRYAEELEGKE